MHKWIMFTFLSAAALLGVYLLGFAMPEKPVDESENLPEGTVYMKIVAKTDFTFGQDVYTAKVGDKVILKLDDKMKVHGVGIDELNIDLNKENPQAEIELTEPGEYVLYCNIPCGQGHVTMKSKFIVEAA